MIIGTNFKLSSAKFLDDRQLCKDYATLIANTEGIIYPPGFEVFCEYENKYYQYVSDTNGGYVWEERKSGVSDGTSASIKDDTISEEYTWSSAHIDSMRIDLETLITQANDYVDEIDERMLFIEGKFQWFEYFDGSYNSLTDKPIIPTKLSELENDSEFLGIERLELELESVNEKIDTKIDKEEDRTLISVTELERLSTVDNYNDTEVRQLITELETQAHTHINSDILDTITEEKINQWDNNAGVDDYNYIQNKPIIRVGDDSDILLNFGQIIDEGMYIITAMVGEYKIHNELVHVKWADDDNVTLTIPNMFMVLNASRTDGAWTIVNELHYGIDKENGKISDTLTIGEDKIILDKEGNGWYGGKVSQEGIPTEDKDLVTKGYVDNKFATNERVSAIEKENARRDVIIEALTNGRRRTVETDGNDVDLMFSTEKDKVWIDKIEGETLVNVCDQEEPIAITKSYTVEGTNHVPLQGEYDGKARPVVHGNTLVNHNVEYDKSVITGEKLDNTHGTEILNLEGTPGCEIKVDIDGHTAINLSTKKEDILCKSFDSASGNEINLVAEENSVSDLVIQGNTMVNLCRTKINYTLTNEIVNNFESVVTNEYDTYYEYVCTNSLSESNLQLIKWDCKLVYPLENGKTYTYVLPNNIPQDTSFNRYNIHYNNINYYKEGELNLIPFTVNQIEDTFGTNFYFYSIYSDIPAGVNRTIRMPKWIMIFEGDLTQTPELIPTEYVEGLQSTFEDKLIPYSIYNGDNLTSITETQYQLPLTVKVGKTYTITTTANVGTTENHKYQYGVYSADGLTNYLEYESCSPTQTFVCDKANILFKVRMYPSYSGDDYSFTLSEVKDKFLIVEGDWTDRLDLLTEEYFGKYRVDMNSHGKNLFNVQTSYSVPNKTCFIHAYPIKSQTSYTISLNYVTGNSFSIMLSNIDYRDTNNHDIVFSKVVGSSYQYGQELAAQDNNKITFNSQNYKYLYVSSWVYNGTGLEVTNIQLEEGIQATSYEPYFGSSKTVYLNSPLLNGDELLTKDGKLYHYHKMGMVVLDGSEDWDSGFFSDGGVSNASTSLVQIVNWADGEGNNNDINVISDNFSGISAGYLWNNDVEGICLNVYNILQIRITKSKLSTTDINGFKQWLSENPTTAVYELASPYYEEISSTEDMRFNIATNSTIKYQSNVPMANTQFLPYRNELPLLESSTQYRVTFDCDVEGIELMVSLGGTSQTITSGLHNELSFITPSLQTDGKLTIDGYGIAKIDNVLITKGDMEYKYFEGLKSGFEDGYIPENLTNINEQLPFNVTFDYDTKARNILKITDFIFKPNTTYTVKIDGTNNSEGTFMVTTDSGEGGGMNIKPSSLPLIEKITTNNKVGNLWIYWTTDCGSSRSCTIDSISILEGDWTHLTEEDWNNLGTYKATIRIQNPNAPIFGKGGRL